MDLVNGVVIILLVEIYLIIISCVSHKVITPLAVLGLPMKFRILSELDGCCVVTQQLNKVINLWSEVEILQETPKPHCLVGSNATSNVLCLHS